MGNERPICKPSNQDVNRLLFESKEETSSREDHCITTAGFLSLSLKQLVLAAVGREQLID